MRRLLNVLYCPPRAATPSRTGNLPSNRPTVVFVACSGYEAREVRAAVSRTLTALPGLSARLRPGLRLLLKPNVVNPVGPERPICTHPQVLRAVAEFFREVGCSLLVGDQPTYARKDAVDEVFGKAGYLEALRGLPVEWSLAATAGYRESPVPRPCRTPAAYLSRLVDEVDLVVNLPKLKTHMQTGLTAAVKNTFGLVAPRQRMDLHALGPAPVFGEAVADTFGACPPMLSLLEAVVAMEGPGPTRGGPRQVGYLAASWDAVALDATAQALAGFGPQEVATTSAAAAAGYGCADLRRIELAGDDPEGFRVRLRRPPALPARMPRWLGALGRRLVYVRPEVNRRRCSACRRCQAACPEGCVRVEGFARIDYRRCLECFCCLEACPEEAISPRRSLVARLL